MRGRSMLIWLVCLLSFMAAYVIGHTAVEKKRQHLLIRYKAPEGLLMSGLAPWVVGEYKGLLADYLLLEAGSFIGSNQKGSRDDWRHVYRVLKQSLALDPYFMQSYLYAQGNLPWEARMVQETIELLDIAALHRNWDWRPGYFAGFDYYYFLNDFAKAGERFLKTAQVPHAPVLLAVLGGRMSMKGDKTETAIALLQSMLNNPQLEDASVQEIQWRIEALKGVMALDKAIGQYQRTFHSYPAALTDLVEEDIIPSLPHNPYGESFIYNPQTGRVAFDKIR